MESAVSYKSGDLGETFAALGARKRLLSRVDSLVFYQIGFPSKAFAAVGAEEGLLPRVDSLVLNKVGFLLETLAAAGAGKGLLLRESRVSPLVDQQRIVLGEALTAVRTGENLVAMGRAVGRKGEFIGSHFPNVRNLAVHVGVLES